MIRQCLVAKEPSKQKGKGKKMEILVFLFGIIAFVLFILVAFLGVAGAFIGTIVFIGCIIIAPFDIYREKDPAGRRDITKEIAKIILVSGVAAVLGIVILYGVSQVTDYFAEKEKASPEHQAMIAQRAASLDKFLSGQLMNKDEIWWVDRFGPRGNYGDFKQYREIFIKYLGPCPDDDASWIKYYDEKVFPALQLNFGIIYMPKEK